MNMKKKGFSILELLLAMAIFGIFFIVVFDSIGSVYFSQKRINISQSFYGEVRFLMERVISHMRENTIDYDRYFLMVGPDVANCPNFHSNQRPILNAAADDCSAAGAGTCTNNKSNRSKFEYSDIFTWDTTADDIPDTDLGGETSGGVDDDCVQSFSTVEVDWGLASGVNKSLLLINGDRDKRYALRYVVYTEDSNSYGRIELQTQLAADTDNDGTADTWGPDGTTNLVSWDSVNSRCEMTVSGTDYLILGSNTEQNCRSAHNWEAISLKKMDITDVSFLVTPDTDPFLAFRRDDVQIHPNVWIQIQARLKDAEDQGYTATNTPTMSLQTTISSRVLGNTR